MNLAEFEEKYGAVVDGKYIGGRTIPGVFCAHGLIIIYGDLVLPAVGIYELSANLRIDGNLNLAGTSIKVLNAGLAVSGVLTLSGSQVRRLPDNVVAGKMIAENSRLVSIGANLTVKGDLDLGGSDIKYIGPHLRVAGTLSLCGTKLKRLSEDVEVGALNLENSELEVLPEKLTVASSLVLTGTKVRRIGDWTTIKGTFDLSDTEIRELPVGLTVSTDFEEVYDDLTCLVMCFNRESRSWLILKNTPVTELPEELCAEGLDLTGSNVEMCECNAEVEKLILTKGLRRNPEYFFNVCFIDINNGTRDAIETAFYLRPEGRILVTGEVPELPENFDLDSELVLKDAVCGTFPQKAFAADIKLVDTRVSFIPSGFRAGHISIHGRKSNCLFDGYFRCAKLEIRDTPIAKLPEKIDFKRLIVADSPIESLPANLRNPGAIYLENTNMAKLPENLEIGYLQIIGPGSQISMPDSLVIVNNSLQWENFPFESWPENLLVFGEISLPNSRLSTVVQDKLAQFALQKKERNQLTWWKNGRFVSCLGAGNFEIIARKANRLKLRKICTYDEFWVEDGDPKWAKLFVEN